MPLIELDGVTHFYGTHRALHEVTFSVEPGAIGLIGQNGAGKSTLLKILLGLLTPTSGTGNVLGFDLRRQSRPLRSRVGFMPEAESLIPGVRGVDLVALAGELSGMPRRQALRRAHEVLSHLELDEARYRRCEDYSIGMKQRLKLAAALVHDPDLLLLDEPTAGLDPAGRDAMLRLLRAIATRHGKSLLLSTHLLGDIDRVCQQVIIVDRGAVLGVGRIEDLCQQRVGRYRLRWSGDAEGFLAQLKNDGVTITMSTSGDQAQVDVPENWTTRQLFERSVAADITLHEVIPEEEDLQQVYRRLVLK
jgi:ABC-2 type transport system ATP-binding protein